MNKAPFTFLMPYTAQSNGSDPHLREGLHLRWFSNPFLGLPTQPVEIYRMKELLLERLFLERVGFNRNVYIFNSLHQSVRLPYTLPAEEELYIYIPYPDQFLAGKVDFSGSLANTEAYGEISLPHKGYRPVVSLELDGWIGAGGIHRVRIKGPITITNFYWVDFKRLHDPENDINHLEEDLFDLIHKVPLPADSAPRYNGVSNFEAQAEERVSRGAPLRMGLHDDFSASNPNAAAIISPDKEVERVQVLAKQAELHNILERLLNDTSESPINLVSRQDMGEEVVADMPLLQSLMLSLLDPGIARWLGFAEIDEEVKNIQSLYLLYRISANYNFREIDISRDDFPKAYIPFIENHIAAGNPNIHTYVLVRRTNFPQMQPISAFQARTGAWTTGGEPILRQAELQFNIPPIDIPYQYAIRKRQLPGASLESLNQLEGVAGKYRLGMSINEPSIAANYQVRKYLDIETGEEAQGYSIAIADLFGRWSDWSEATLAKGVLVPPPAPVLQANYLISAAIPVNDSPRAGQIRLKVPIPNEPAPGSPFINRIDLQLFRLEDDGTETFISSQNFPISTAMNSLETTIEGPPLGRGEKMLVVLRAKYLARGLSSVEDGVARLEAVDPRPPASLVFIPNVRYTTLPDSKGNGRIKLQWTARAGHEGYRIFCASQRALEPFLENLGTTASDALAESQDIKTPAATLASTLNDFATQFPKNLFTLQNKTLIRPDASGEVCYELTLPGRSRMLYVLRVLAVSPSAIEEPWTNTPALQYVAVPSSIRIQAPSIELSSVDTGLEVRIKPAPGQRIGRVRIFRANNPSVAFTKMSLVQEASVSFTEGIAQIYTFTDEGATRISPTARLFPWRTYTYRAQVQPPIEADIPAGAWSTASAPASKVNIPPGPPPLAVFEHITRTGSNVEITWNCPALKVRSTDLGNHYFRLLRVANDGSLAREVYRVDALLPMQFQDQDVPENVRYILQVIDPLGRVSTQEMPITRLDFPLPSSLAG